MKLHLVELAGRVRELELKCHCGVYASRFMRCRTCRQVVSRCGAHGDRMPLERDQHCAG